MPGDKRTEPPRQGNGKKRLTGETLLWLKIASRQGRSVPEAMEANPASHLWLWEAYFEHERNEHEKIDYYLAQISRDIRRVLAKDPKRIKLEQSLLKFEARKDREQSSPETSKRAWLTALGLGKDGKPLGGLHIRRDLPPRVVKRTRSKLEPPRRATRGDTI